MVYVMSDLHGYPLDKIINNLDNIGFSEEDKLYILGDVIDRGEEGVEILQWAMSQPFIELLLGNHEDMLLKNQSYFQTEEEIIKTLKNPDDEYTIATQSDYSNWIINGGDTTCNKMRKLSNEKIAEIFTYLRKAPLYKEIEVNGKSFVLVHAGLGKFKKEKKLSEYEKNDLIWYRPYMETTYYYNKTVIFGHTPTFFFGEKYSFKVIKTPTWINIDVGAAGGYAPAVLRLDDLKVFYA